MKAIFSILTLAFLSISGKIMADDELPSASVYHLSNYWTDQSGKAFGMDSLAGYNVVMAMIYTSCPSACPMIIADLKHIEKGLSAEELKRTRFVLVSFDAEKDSAEKLLEFSHKMKLPAPAWTLLKGSAADVQALSQTLEIKYRPLATGDFAHSNTILVLDKHGVIIRRQEGREGMEDTIKALSL
jgi:protein SCO1/2